MYRRQFSGVISQLRQLNDGERITPVYLEDPLLKPVYCRFNKREKEPSCFIAFDSCLQ